MVAVLIGEILGVAAVAVLVVAVLTRRRARDDEHSVEHYHRRLHTLEELQAHEAERAEGTQRAGGARVEHFPVSAVRVSGSSTVRLTEPGGRPAPPASPPPVAHASEPITFDDTGAGPEPIPRSFMTGTDDPAMHLINHRPRRLGGPLAAVAAVAVLVGVLIVTGVHSTSPNRTHRGVSAPTVSSPAHRAATPTAPPVVSGPTAATRHRAVYRVAVEDYALTVAAGTGGSCPVAVGVPAHKVVLFSGTLTAGQSRTLTAKGPVTVIAGAVSTCVTRINGTKVAVPSGARTPFTLVFETAPAG